VFRSPAPVVLRLALTGSLALGATAASAVDGTHISGRAVSINWQYAPQNWSVGSCHADGNWAGSIDLYTITNGSVSGVDTVFSRALGLCCAPAFNLSGASIAFYRLPIAPAADGSCVVVNGGKTTISVLDIGSRAVVDLCDLPAQPLMKRDGTGGLDWPAGDWIYYLRTVGVTNTEVWKVNASSKENMEVCAFTLNGQSGNNAYLRRFSLNLSADRMAVQTMQNSGIGSFTSDVMPFPNACTIGGYTGGCNSAISASGDYQAKFMGYHSQLVLSLFPGVTGVLSPTHGINDYNLVSVFQQTTTNQFGADAEGLAWAVNSDKWVLQQVGWYGYGDSLSYGSEQVACNWVDKVAVRISGNGKAPLENCIDRTGVRDPDCCGGCGTVYRGNCPGDLWIDGGAENAGKFENASGVWHAVSAAGVRGSFASRNALRQLIVSPDARGNLVIGLSGDGASTIRIVDARGRSVYAATAVSRVLVPALTLRPGVYSIVERAGDHAAAVRVTPPAIRGFAARKYWAEEKADSAYDRPVRTPRVFGIPGPLRGDRHGPGQGRVLFETARGLARAGELTRAPDLCR